MKLETKLAVEFGIERKLYRVMADDGWSTLWHSDADRALDAYMRRERRKLASGV